MRRHEQASISRRRCGRRCPAFAGASGPKNTAALTTCLRSSAVAAPGFGTGVRTGPNQQWRVCFRFDKGDTLDVEFVDYH